MIIECEKCHTRYKIHDHVLKKAGDKVRCGRCRHVFAVVSGSEPPSSADEVDFMRMFGGPEITFDAFQLKEAAGAE